MADISPWLIGWTLGDRGGGKYRVVAGDDGGAEVGVVERPVMSICSEMVGGVLCSMKKWSSLKYLL